MSGSLYVQANDYRSLVVNGSIKTLDEFDEVFLAPQGLAPISVDTENASLSDVETKGQWLKPAPVSAAKNDSRQFSERLERIRTSWRNRFFLKVEETHDGVEIKGLCPAQVGAIHATLAHWKVTSKAATLVMPTGTGKTETMLSLLVSERIERLLVIVPTDTLCEQIAHKFLTLGILKEFGIVGPVALYPVVGTLKHRPSSPQKVQDYFARCNVIVTTMSVVGGCSEDVQAEMSKLCTHLFIDEAHHVPASTWKKFRKNFEERVILQFTATPFRNDKKYVDG